MFWVVIDFVINSLINYTLRVQPSESLGLLNYRCPFFPSHCLLLPSLNLHLLSILFHIFQPSHSRSSPSASLQFTLKYFHNCPSLIHSYYMSDHSHRFLLLSAIMSRSLYLPQFLISSYSPNSLLYQWSTYLSHVLSVFVSISPTVQFHSHTLQLVSQSFCIS